MKAVGIALKLTFSGINQLLYPQTWVFTFVVLLCVITQMNYLNKVMNDPLFIAKFVICSDSCLSVVHVKLGYCLVCTSN